MEKDLKKIDKSWKLPSHVAIITDGNGRWAKKHNMPRNYGHAQGSKTIERICEDAYKMGIEYLTFYAFSTENWVRPKEEVDALMNLLRNYMKDCLKISKKNNMRVRIIGDITKLDEDLQNGIINLQNASAKNTGLKLQIAINYGGRDELVRAVKKIVQNAQAGKISVDQIDQKYISGMLDTHDIPDPDLIIRTSGEQRMSNFLTWQSVYSEMYFPDVLWPDFSADDLVDAIEFYNTRDRRFGGV